MSQEERYNKRDNSYSAWHRRLSIRRLVGIEQAQSMAMIDLDAAYYVEYDENEREPLFLVETAIDCGQGYKNGTITRALARRGKMPAYVVLYKLSDQPNPADLSQKDIASFRYRRLWPDPKPEDAEWTNVSPKEWADKLVTIRRYCANRLDADLENAP